MEAYPTGTVWIGTIAEYHPNKGLLYLIDAIADVRATHDKVVCVLIGDGELRQELQTQIEQRGLAQHVFLAGFLEDAATYLSAFDVFVLPSLKEGLPYALLEAGTVGLPFVGSDIPGIQEVVTDMSSGIIVRSRQPREIAGALSLLIEDPKRRASFGHNLKKLIQEDFALEKMLDTTRALYTHLLG
jgi:glycosyltransferase involved in cell wall biosynthesis